MVEETAQVILHAINDLGEPCEVPDQLLESKVVSEIKCVPKVPSMECMRIGRYELNLTPTIKGRHFLHIKISDKHIIGSPFTLLVKSRGVDTPKKLISTIDNVDRPWGIVINHKRQVVITEHEKHRISVFSLGGVKIRSFGTYGANIGQFNHPRGVAVDEKDNILVADYKNNRIQKFTSDGDFLATVGTKGNKILQFKGPNGIAFNSFNKKVYVIDENCHVQILNSDLTYCTTFGEPGVNTGQLSNASGIGCDRFGRVYIPIRFQSLIQVFTADDIFLSVINFLSWPFSVAIGDNDILFVSDYFMHRVFLFALDGEFLNSFDLEYPRGLTVDNGVLYVCDDQNNRISLF